MKMVYSCPRNLGFIFVLFGSTGDLTARKLMPALYRLFRQRLLPQAFVCVAFGRREKTSDSFRKDVLSAIVNYLTPEELNAETGNDFVKRIFYYKGEFTSVDDCAQLKHYLASLDAQFHTQGNRIFYLATPPSHFSAIIAHLHQAQLLRREKERWFRVIIEKPFGRDFASATALQNKIAAYLQEKELYRIDHYLGKEVVQNLFVFRFTNFIFESLWNRNYIKQVQITVGEEIGIGTRGAFFEETGLLRDIVQNHVMQLLSLIAMEPPTSSDAESIRNAKIDVLRAIRPLSPQEVIRKQYQGYREEENVDPLSSVETFMALQLSIDNPRWQGVPFLLRAGKALPCKTTEVVILFHTSPPVLFLKAGQQRQPNMLVFKIQPNEGIWLQVNSKSPGLDEKIEAVKMNFSYQHSFSATLMDAYERLICDCITGDQTLFTRDEEVLLSWKLWTPLLEYWKGKPLAEDAFYPFGSWPKTPLHFITPS